MGKIEIVSEVCAVSCHTTSVFKGADDSCFLLLFYLPFKHLFQL